MPSRQSPLEGRQPGRSFEDPSKPMGEALLEHSGPSNPTTQEDFRSREAQAAARPNGVAERASVIGVLRKLEELVVESNLPKGATLRRAVELAAARGGLALAEYDALVRGDAELEALERKVLEGVAAQLTARGS